MIENVIRSTAELHVIVTQDSIHKLSVFRVNGHKREVREI